MAFCSWKKGEKYRDNFESGLYVCARCNHQLFSSETKFEHDSPWPAFTQTVLKDSVAKRLEKPGAFKVSCGSCSNGLGHEFIGDGPKGGSRF